MEKRSTLFFRHISCHVRDFDIFGKIKLSFFYSPKLDISYHVFFQMLMKRKNLDRHIMDVWILIQLMINHQKWEFDFSKNIKITNVTRNVSKKKFSSFFLPTSFIIIFKLIFNSCFFQVYGKGLQNEEDPPLPILNVYYVTSSISKHFCDGILIIRTIICPCGF